MGGLSEKSSKVIILSNTYFFDERWNFMNNKLKQIIERRLFWADFSVNLV